MSDPRRDPWWTTAVTYQIYPRSYCDTTGDGVGDLEGIRRHLDHVQWLGVDALWLSPIYPSPMTDYGYDVSDFCAVDPAFGDLATFDALLAEAHQRNLRVLLDWVPNHTSDQHPWFVESRSSRDHPRRDWYLWRDPAPDGGPPNNWVESLTFGPAWTFDEATGQYYLHNFLSSQPDLNWGNPEVVEAMFDTLRFWLDRGVDGFRMDVVHCIGKDPALPDDPPEANGLPHVLLNDRPETHALLRDIRRLLDSYPGDRLAIGEVYLLTIDAILGHLGNDDELHLAFNFPPLHQPWEAARWREAIAETEAAYGALDATPTWVLSNHDVVRHRTRFGGSEARARAAAVLLTTLRGAAFLYAGEELGLEDAVVPAERTRDPAGRDGCRAPLPWEPGPRHGWATAEPWLPWPPDPADTNAESLRGRPGSILHLYRTLLDLRRREPALTAGSLELIDAPDGVVAYRRTPPEGRPLVVAINFVAEARPLADWRGEVLVSTADRSALDEVLHPDEAVILG